MDRVLFSKHAQKDAEKLKRTPLAPKCQEIIKLLSLEPFAINPLYEKLVGDLKGFYSRRINIQHRLVYEVDEAAKIVKVLRIWSHYE
jgi:toxin YoeB